MRKASSVVPSNGAPDPSSAGCVNLLATLHAVVDGKALIFVIFWTIHPPRLWSVEVRVDNQSHPHSHLCLYKAFGMFKQLQLLKSNRNRNHNHSHNHKGSPIQKTPHHLGCPMIAKAS